MDAQCILRAITLRGIGSYLHGARLEIRPLTILCGTNGSGKSTWLKALNMLKYSIANSSPGEPFPFHWRTEGSDLVNDENINNMAIINAFMHLSADEKENTFLTDPAVEDAFGPPCSVGLEFEAVQDFAVTDHDYGGTAPKGDPQRFLWSGDCKKGTRFAVKISHPKHYTEDSHISGLYHLVELRLNEKYLIRFSTSDRWDYDNGESDSDGKYTLECSAVFLPEFRAIPADQIVTVARLSRNLENVAAVTDAVDQDYARRIVVCAVDRIVDLLTHVLSGCFYVGAIRDLHQYASLDEADDAEPLDMQKAIETRYVGQKGEATWYLERRFAYNPMAPLLAISHDRAAQRQPASDFDRKWREVFGPFDGMPLLFEGFVSKWSEELLRTTIQLDPGTRCSTFLSSPWPDSPVGFLTCKQPPASGQLDELDNCEDGSSYESLQRLEHPCFESEPQNPRQMSSGFHQLLPLIVQLGLMRQYEIMAVENPEVHLHPSLQLQVAEFLMHQAKAGKWIIFETHSDLMVRRIIREILEEKIGQEKVRIYFTSVDKAEQGYSYSTIEPIEIDEMGRIANWPGGFLDDDLQESRRLFDIMYGVIPDNLDSVDDEDNRESLS